MLSHCFETMCEPRKHWNKIQLHISNLDWIYLNYFYELAYKWTSFTHLIKRQTQTKSQNLNISLIINQHIRYIYSPNCLVSNHIQQDKTITMAFLIHNLVMATAECRWCNTVKSSWNAQYWSTVLTSTKIQSHNCMKATSRNTCWTLKQCCKHC